MMNMGFLTYAFSVCIPSPLELGKWARDDKYYYGPWETMADMLGGVTHRYGEPIPQQQITNAWIYYAISRLCPILAVIFWI